MPALPKDHPGFFKTREETEAWLKKQAIIGYTVNKDLSVDAYIVSLGNENLTFIPVQFRNVEVFNISKNKLTTLKGSPKSCLNFSCEDNLLTSLKYAPLKIKYGFCCSNNQLTTLEHCPKGTTQFDCSANQLKNLIGFNLSGQHYQGIFICSNNQLASLEGAPSSISDDFQCDNNLLKNLQYAPTNVGISFLCDNNLLETIKGAPINIGEHFSMENNPTLLSMDFLPEKVGKMFLFDNCGPLFEKYQGIETNGNATTLIEKIRLEQLMSNKQNSLNSIIKI